MTTHADSEPLIDAKALLASTSIEELSARADELVRSMVDPSALLARPVGSFREAPDLLACFGLLLSGLAPMPGMTVLDFGAGTCWTSYFLTQMGCRVIAMDISEAMLDLGRRRFKEHPVFGTQPEPSFSVFDGHKMDLEDESVDRILCFDALHHVANMPEVICEMGRVLRPGGVAGFSEPGPNHSKDAQSQNEMRRYGVPELDLVIEEVWSAASAAGFADLSVALFAPAPQWVSLQTFDDFLQTSPPAETPGHRPLSMRVANRAVRVLHPRHSKADPVLLRLQRLFRLAAELQNPASARAALAEVSHIRVQLHNRRMFLMRKAGEEFPDSRQAAGLRGDVKIEGLQVETGPVTTRISGTAIVTNTGQNRWLPSNADRGAVLLGLRLRHGKHPSDDHGRVWFPGDSMVNPGDTVVLPFSTEVDTPPAGSDPVVLELDLVSEGMCWFAEVAGRPIDVPVPPVLAT
ncbi:MAG: class I SAM-dependent methyltransferase [Acidimicrobiales bacterium]